MTTDRHADEALFAAAGITVGDPELPAPDCTLGTWHANDAAGQNLDCGSADMILEGNAPGGNYPGKVATVHRVLRTPTAHHDDGWGTCQDCGRRWPCPGSQRGQ